MKKCMTLVAACGLFVTGLGEQSALATIFTVSQAGTPTGNGNPAANYGQSFTPNVPGDSAPLGSNPDTVLLTQFEIITNTAVAGRFLNIYDATISPGDDGAGIFVGSSTNAITTTAGGASTWDFANLELDFDGGTRYFAVYSTTNTAGSVVVGPAQPVSTPSNYSGGAYLHHLPPGQTGELVQFDTVFTATFTTGESTAPEPSTFVLAGMAVCGLFVRQRRRQSVSVVG